MIKKSSRILAVAALCAATAVAGCGGDDEPNPTTAQTTPAANSPADAPDATPTQKWIRSTCDQLSKSMQALQPPQVDGTTPEDTKASLVTFFEGLSGQLGKQEEILEAVGAPPGPNAAREYRDAVQELGRVQGRIDRVIDRVKASKADNEKAVQALVVDLGESLKVMSDFDGPVARFAESKSLGTAVEEEPSCASLTVTGGPTE